jgi:hypothetical protein
LQKLREAESEECEGNCCCRIVVTVLVLSSLLFAIANAPAIVFCSCSSLTSCSSVSAPGSCCAMRQFRFTTAGAQPTMQIHCRRKSDTRLEKERSQITAPTAAAIT